MEITLTLRSIDIRRSVSDTGSSDINIATTINYPNQKITSIEHRVRSWTDEAEGGKIRTGLMNEPVEHARRIISIAR